MPRTLGLHWPDPNRVYPDGTPFVERVVCYQTVGVESHVDRVAPRVAALRANHPASPIIVRVDYRPGIAIPRDSAERAEYLGPPGAGKLAFILNRNEWKNDPLVWFQCGNEPQLEGAPLWSDVADVFNGSFGGRSFVERCSVYVHANSLRLPASIAPYHPNTLGAPTAPPGIEGSPWARLQYAVAVRIIANGVPAKLAWSLHAYGDPATEPKDWDAWEDPRDPNGWRFEYNVLRTWDGAIGVAEGATRRAAYVTELNTAARGTQPQANFVRGWMVGAVGALRSSYPMAQWAAWFVGDSAAHDGQWAGYALHNRTGALAAADDEFAWLKSHGW